MEISKINKYISALSNPKVNKYDLMAEVMSVLSFDELQFFKRKTPMLFQGLLKFSYLKRKKFSDIFSKGKILWSNSVDLYGTLSFIIQNNSKDINRYLQLKEELDNATSVMQYAKAYSLLDQIEKEISVSMTGTYYRLKLVRLDKGVTVSTQFYNEICKQNDILSYFSNIAYKSSPIDIPFEAEIEGRYRTLRGNEELSDFFTAFAFPFKKTKGTTWLRLLTNTSIIDLYEGFIFQLGCINKDELRADVIKHQIDELATLINDRRLHRLYSLLNGGKLLPGFKKNEKEKELIEKYYSQDYEFVLDKGFDYLKGNPLEASIMDVFYKSCIKLDRIPTFDFPEGSLAERMHSFYALSLADDEISDFCRVQLRSMCIAWYVIPSLRMVYQSLHDIEHFRKESVYNNFWRYSLVPEIRDSAFYGNSDEAIHYLIESGYPTNNCAQIEILEKKREDIFNQTYRMLFGFQDSEIDSYRREIEENEHTPAITSVITSQLFDRLIEIGQYSDAISLYVNCLLVNPYAKIQIDKQAIAKRLTDSGDALIQDQLELAVFYTMIGAEVYKRYLAYKRFLKKSHLSKASEISDINSPLLLYFIGKVADRSVLTLHVLQFDKEEDVANERIELCKRLFKITNEKKYADEVTSLIKEQEVKELAQQVNDSKIHVDVQSLVNSGFSSVKILFDTYSEIDDNLEMYEQKNFAGILDYIKEQYEGKTVFVRYELPSVKYKKVIFRQMVLSIRDKFLFDPIYGLDKYLSARIRHGTLITQLRNHFLTHNLVTNIIEGGDYQRVNPWSQHEYAHLTDNAKEKINERMLQFTGWLDNQLKSIKEDKIQIKTERAEGRVDGLFDYSEDVMEEMIDSLEGNTYDSFEAFVHSTIEFLWKWTNLVLEFIRNYFKDYESLVIKEMTTLESDIIPMMAGSTLLINNFKDAITACRTEFQSDIAIVSNWFKPERSTVRYFTIQQAVDTSRTVINKINQNALSFCSEDINDQNKYKGDYFNAIHDIFHDMMNNILQYEMIRPKLKRKGRINISTIGNKLVIDVSNPFDPNDTEKLNKVIADQKNIPALIAKGKTRGENNSGCTKIYSTVMYTLGFGNIYYNKLENGYFVAHIEIDTKYLIYHEDTDS